MSQIIKLKNAKEKVVFTAPSGQVIEGEFYFSTYGFLRNAANLKPADSGFTPDEMMKRGRLLAALAPFEKQFQYPKKTIEVQGKPNEVELSDEELPEDFLTQEAEMTLEDADAELLISLWKQMRFEVRSEFVIELNNHLNEVSESLKKK